MAGTGGVFKDNIPAQVSPYPHYQLHSRGHSGRVRKEQSVIDVRMLSTRLCLKIELRDRTENRKLSLPFPPGTRRPLCSRLPILWHITPSLLVPPVSLMPIKRQVSSSEAVTEALRSTLPSPRFVPPPSSTPAPISSTPLSEEAPHSDGARLWSAGDGSEKEGLLGASSNEYTRGRGDIMSEGHRFEQGRAGEGAEVYRRESDQEKPPLPREARLTGGNNDVGEDQPERALPMLWPPPKSCVVIRDEICRVPLQIVVSCE